MEGIEDDPPGFAEWLEEQQFRERQDNAIRCGSCGSEMWNRLTDGDIREPSRGRYFWICRESSCGHAWQMKGGQMVRKPESDAMLLCSDPECCCKEGL